MNDHPTTSRHAFEKSVESRVAAAAVSYQELCEAGKRPNRKEFLAQHCEIASELESCLDAIDFVAGAAPRESSLAYFEAPRVLGEFRILRQLGRGGMGVVYEAEQASLHRRVALKVLPTIAALDERALQRFRNESQAAAALRHPHIVPVFAIGQEQGVHYFAMQLVAGESLAAIVRRLNDQHLVSEAAASTRKLNEASTAPLQPIDPTSKPTSDAIEPSSGGKLLLGQRYGSAEYFRAIAKLFIDAAFALQHAHDVGVLHRDIKPANLMLEESGHIWVADFGLAKLPGSDLTGSADVMGTLRYMAPEQASGKTVSLDVRTDVYSLGATLYELLTLHRAFDEETQESLLRKVLLEEPTRPRKLAPQIPRDLETIVLKAMAKAPNERYETVREFGQDLQRFLADKPILARRTTLMEQSWRWCRQNRLIASLALLIIGLLTALATIQVVKNSQLSRAIGDLNDSNQKLGKTNSQLATALKDVEVANKEATERLFQSYLDQLKLGRTDTTPGARERGLETISAASKLRPSLELRNEAFEYLRMASFQPLGTKEPNALPVQDREPNRLIVKFQPPDELVISKLVMVEGVRRAQVIHRLKTSDAISDKDSPLLTGFPDPENRLSVLVFAIGQPTEHKIHSAALWNLEKGVKVRDLPIPSYPTIFHWTSSDRFLTCDASMNLMEFEAKAVGERSFGRLQVGRLNRLFISPNGEAIAAIGNRGVERIYFADANPNSFFPIAGARGKASWGGKWLAVLASGGLVHLCDLDQTRTVRTISTPSTTNEIAMSPKDDWMLSYDTVCTKLWNVRDGRLLATFPNGADDISFNKSGDLLKWSGREQYQITPPPETWECDVNPLNGDAYEIEFSLDSKRVMLKTLADLRVWDTKGGTQVMRVPGQWSDAIFDSTGESIIAFSRETRRLERINLPLPTRLLPAKAASMEILLNDRFEKNHSVYLHVNGSSVYLAVATSEKPLVVKADIDLMVQRVVEVPEMGRAKPFYLSSSKAAISFGSRIRNRPAIWNIDSGRLVKHLPFNVGNIAAVSGDEKTLVAISSDGVTLLDLGTSQKVATFPLSGRTSQSRAAISHDHQLLAIYHNGIVELRDTKSQLLLAKWTEPNQVFQMLFSPDGQYFGIMHHTSFQLWDLLQVRNWLAAHKLDWDRSLTITANQ